MANLLGIFLALVSPVYFPAERAPALMQAVGWTPPLRCAADGMMKALSGDGDAVGVRRCLHGAGAVETAPAV